MVDKVTVPTARASILWLIGEYSDRISKLAPDVLRKMAKTFPDEVKHRLKRSIDHSLFVGNHRQTSNSQSSRETLRCQCQTDSITRAIRV